MKGQRYLRFPKGVTRFLTGDYASIDEIVLPLFRELSAEEEAAFRFHARENYTVGSVIEEEVYHPVWCDEARKMNREVSEIAND